MQLNTPPGHLGEPSFLKAAPKEGWGQPMLAALPRWGDRQWQHQPELNRKGVGAPSQGSSDGGQDAGQASETQSPMGPDQKQSAEGDRRPPAAVGPSAEGGQDAWV